MAAVVIWLLAISFLLLRHLVLNYKRKASYSMIYDLRRYLHFNSELSTRALSEKSKKEFQDEIKEREDAVMKNKYKAWGKSASIFQAVGYLLFVGGYVFALKFFYDLVHSIQ